jgi:hypothetical protein
MLFFGIYPPSQKTTGLPVDECEAEADNHGVAEGEDG